MTDCAAANTKINTMLKTAEKPSEYNVELWPEMDEEMKKSTAKFNNLLWTSSSTQLGRVV